MKIGRLTRAWIVILIFTMVSVGICLKTTGSNGARASRASHSAPAKARNTGAIAAVRPETPRPAISPAGIPDGELASAPAKRPMGDRSKGFESLSDAMSAARHALRTPGPAELDLEINRDVRYWAANPAESMVARFLDGAVKMQSSLPGSAWSVTVKRPGPAPQLSVAGDRVEYQHADGVLEWYENLPAGFHHGFTVPKPLTGSRSGGKLCVELEVDGLSVEADGDSEDALCFSDGGGQALVGYRGLKAWDARGQELDASMVPSGNGFMLVVNDRDAIYPVQIDPYYLNLEQSLVPTMTGTGGSTDNLGSSVAISGNTAVAAATGVAPGGRVYVFVNDGTQWSLETELWPSDGQSGDGFGYSVDLEGDTLVVGAVKADLPGKADAGCAYVYQRTAGVWTQQAKLFSPYYLNPSASNGWFGVSVSLSGDELAIGSNYNHVYMFRRTAGAWNQEDLLAIGNYGFGRTIALDGDTILIGAPSETVNLVQGAGVVYVWERRDGIWDEVDWFAAPTALDSDQFGSVLALDGDVAVIGAPNTDQSTGGQTDYGAAYIFRRNGDNWFQQAVYRGTMLPQDGFGERMGAAVAVSGDLVVVGTPGNLSASLGVGGMANVYQWNGTSWTNKAKLSYSPVLVGDKFGNGVAVDGGRMIVGAPWHQGVGGAGDNFGSVFFYEDAPSGGPWPPVQQWTEGNGKGGIQLGSAVAMNGNTAVVGAPYENGMVGSGEGAAYVFVKSNELWQEQARMVQPNPSAALNFGRRVALDGNTVVVGSGDTNVAPAPIRGRAEVFVRSGSSWSHQQTLAGNQSSTEGFANAIGIAGDLILVGAPYADNGGPGLNNGNVHAFKRTGTVWTQNQLVTPSSKLDNQNFGSSVDIDGTTAVIGAQQETTDTFGGAGRAHVFTTDGTTWTQRASLKAPTPSSYALFGTAVAIHGNTLVVGAPGVDGPEATGFPWSNGGVGQAYVFTGSGASWTHQATLTPEGTSQSTGFGSAVALHGNYAVISAGGQSAAYLFTRSGTTWTRQNKYQFGVPTNPGSFGQSVAVEGDTVMIGAPGANRTVASINRVFGSQGMVQIYRISTSPAFTVTNGDGAALTDGDSEIGFDGTTSTRWVSQTLTISNTSDAPMSGLVLTVTGSQASMFTVSGWTPGPLAVGESRQIVVQFQPTVMGNCTAVLKIAGSNGTFEVQLAGTGLTPREAFDQWAAGLADADPAATPHHDGVSNLVKYAFNLNGAAPDHRTLVPLTGVAGLPVGQIDRSGPTPVYHFEYLRRTGSGLVYTPECSSSLGQGTFTSPAGSPGIQPINGEWERVVHEIPMVPGEACFLRVKVSLP